MKSLIVAALAAVGIAHPVPQVSSSRDIEDAIRQGRAGKSLSHTCTARTADGLDIVAEGPYGRIMRAAAAAKRNGREMRATDVTPDLLLSTLTVSARRVASLRSELDAKPMAGSSVAAVAVSDVQSQERDRARRTMSSTFETQLTIRSKAASETQLSLLRPLGPIAYSRQNTVQPWVVSGGSAAVPMEGSDLRAQFDLAEFKALPPGDVEIVVFMTDIGERGCKISEKDRLKLR